MNRENSLLDSIRRVIRRTANELKQRNAGREEPLKELPPELPSIFRKGNIDINVPSGEEPTSFGTKKPKKTEELLPPGYTKSISKFTPKPKD